MKKYVPAIVAGLFMATGLGMALTLEDATLEHEGKTGLKDLCRIINANNTLLEALSGSDITSGNIAVARITNAAVTLGPSIGGNIPVAAITNAAATVGPSIGGNIPSGAVTNVLNTAGLTIGAWNVNAATNVPAGNLVGTINVARLGGLTYTQDCITAYAGGVTNRLFFTNGLLVVASQL